MNIDQPATEDVEQDALEKGELALDADASPTRPPPANAVCLEGSAHDAVDDAFLSICLAYERELSVSEAQLEQLLDRVENEKVRFAITCLATSGWRRLRLFGLIACVAGAVLLIWEFVEKLKKPGDLFVSTTRLLDATIGPAVACVLVTLAATVIVAWRLLIAARHNEPWGRGLIQGVEYVALALLLQLANASLWLGNLVYCYIHLASCPWSDDAVAWMGGMQLTLWNLLFFLYILQAMQLLPAGSWLPLFKPFKSQQPATEHSGSTADQTVQGKSCKHQGHFIMRLVQCGVCALFWLPTQGLVYAAMNQAINSTPERETYSYAPAQLVYISDDATVCAGFGWPSLATNSAIRVVGALVAMLITMVLVFVLFSLWVSRHLGDWRRPYCKYRVQNLAVRLVWRTRIIPFVISIAAVASAWFVHPASYDSYAQVWLGLGPMHIAMTATVVIEALLFIPHDPAQKFDRAKAQRCTMKWMEKDVPAQRPAPGLVFCFETALKASYLSCLAYVECCDPSKPPSASNTTTKEGGRGLCDCTEDIKFNGQSRDANCLVMWGADTLVVSFRGTDSWRNRRADLMLWPSRYQTDPPVGDDSSWWDCPKVHCGFLDSWQDDTFKDRVMAQIQEVLNNRQSEGLPADGAQPFRILITGHSLGASMAHLCSMDVARWLKAEQARFHNISFPQPPDPQRLRVSLSCYTFGAPHTGNGKFAKLFAKHVPDCWDLVYGQDPVAHHSSLSIYRRPGHLVLLTKDGYDLVPQASHIEFCAHRLLVWAFGVFHMSHHQMAQTYCPALGNVPRTHRKRRQEKCTLLHEQKGATALHELKDATALHELVEQNDVWNGPVGGGR